MLALLPVLALAWCVLACKARIVCWREALLAGSVIWGVVLVASTELLSTIQALNAVGVGITWLAALVLGFWFTVRASTWPRSVQPQLHAGAATTAILGPLATIVLVLGALSVISAPDTWDSMTYHLARIVHWQQAASVAPYPTHILRQLYLQPAAEYALLHLQLLSGGDRFAGLVQWASMVGALVGISLIAQHLGARHGGVLCSVLLAASLPTGILESTSTQNDYVVTFWLVCLVVFAFRFLQSPAPDALPSWPLAGLIGASLGLALLTKATAYLIGASVVAWLAVSTLRRWRHRALPLLVGAAGLALSLNASFTVRNLTVFGSPFGPPDEGAPALRYFNDALTPPLLVSNVVRDLGVNLVATPFTAINIRALNAVTAVHSLIGADIADPRTTWGGEVFHEQRVDLAFDENFSSNPVHLVVLCGALAAVWPLRRRLAAGVPVYALALVSGFLLFAALLRWQPWDTRLELPWFILGAPLVGVVLETFAPRACFGVAVLLLCGMLPWVVGNQARPLVGPGSVLNTDRVQQYFTFRADLEPAYLGAVDFLMRRGCRQIGFISDQDGWEYPLWAVSAAVPLVEHVDVHNASSGTRPLAFRPCGVLALGPAVAGRSIDVDGSHFVPAWTQADVAVLTVNGT